MARWTALALVVVKLGALLVLVKLLAVGLGIVLLRNAVLAITLEWRWSRQTSYRKKAARGLVGCVLIALAIARHRHLHL